MIRIRACEESLVQPIISGEVRCPCHLYTGEEAVATGVCAFLKKRDSVFGTHRSHGHYLAKGGNLNEMFAEIFCKETGCSRGRGGSMHLISPESGMMGSAPIVAGTISLALGAALAASIKKERKVTVSFFGDGAMGEGVLYESINFAALRKLPILFVCENNFYSTHLPISECRSGLNLFSSAIPFRVESHRIDGNDVLAVADAARKAIDKCRKGRGPVFLECTTYRLRGHVGPDDNIQGGRTDIRPQKEIERWRKKDPIRRLERYLEKNERIERDIFAAITREVEAEVAKALAYARRSPFPSKGDLIKYVEQA